MVTIDWTEMRQDWIDEVNNTLIPTVRADARFKNSGDLVARFKRETDAWKKKGGSFRPLIEFGNELAAAERLLGTLSTDDEMSYEPPMTLTKKRIDFLLVGSDGGRNWVEVKTVAPTWVDDKLGWLRFERIARAAPANARLVVKRESSGSAISGQAIKSRWSFISRATEVEKRATEIPTDQRGPVWLMLCSDGGTWQVDELEDFADFYRTGAAREDDWLGNAIPQYMRDEGLTFSHSLAGFHYLARRHEDVSAQDFQWDVRGPVSGR